MRQYRHSSAVRPTAGVRNPFCRRESRSGIAQLLINRVAGLQLKFVQCRPDGAFRRVTCMSFRERRCLNAANLGHHQDPNASDNCVIQQVVWHFMIGHSAQFTPGSARHCGDHAVITWTQPHHSSCASKVTASSTISGARQHILSGRDCRGVSSVLWGREGWPLHLYVVPLRIYHRVIAPVSCRTSLASHLSSSMPTCVQSETLWARECVSPRRRPRGACRCLLVTFLLSTLRRLSSGSTIVLMARALSAVNVQKLTRDKCRGFQVKHSPDDVGDRAHPSQGVHAGEDGVGVVGVHRSVDNARGYRVNPDSVACVFNCK